MIQSACADEIRKLQPTAPMPKELKGTMTPLDIILPIELTNGNDGRGSQWYAKDSARKRAEKTLRQLGMVRIPFNAPVRVHVTRILGRNQRLWDSSSIGRGNWKEIEDAMVACGWFHDDGPQWITSTTFDQDATRRQDGPAIRVHITEDKGETQMDDNMSTLLAEFRAEYARACTKFPDSAHCMVALMEEVGELAQACLDEPLDRIRSEAVQVMVVAARVALQGDAAIDQLRAARGLATTANGGQSDGR